MRRLIAIAVSACLILLGILPAAAEGGENVIRYAMSTAPNLDPHWNAGASGTLIQSMLREGLYRVTETGVELAGAEDVEVNEDATVWTFTLRRDAVWNDGKPVTADDYVYSMQRLVDPIISTTYMRDYGQFLKNGTEIADGMMDVSELGVRAVGDYTLEITLANPCIFFDTILAYSTFYPLRSETVTEDGVGNWAWEVENSITNGAMNMVYCDELQQIILEKNDRYWDAANIAADRIEISLLDDAGRMLSMLESGELDIIDNFPSEEAERLKAARLYHSVPKLSTNFLLLNCMKTDSNMLTDVRVRRALSLCIDREYLCSVVMRETKLPAQALVGSGFPGSTADQDFRTEGGALIPEDFAACVAQAQALMAEAGYPGGEGFPVLTCTYSNTYADYDLLFGYLEAVWEENLGIEVQLESIDNAVMNELRNFGRFDITPQGWGADYMDASNMLSIFVTGNPINSGMYRSEEYDSKYAESLQTVDQAARMELLHRCEELLIVEECAIIPLYHASAAAIYSDENLENVRIAANGKLMLTDIVRK